MERELDLSFERAAAPDEPSQLKIQVPSCEVNVRLTRDDLERLRNLSRASWDDRRSGRAGVAAGAQVFWCSENDRVTIMIGEDDETWDIAVTFVGLTKVLAELELS